jgi:hypothetical protein
MSSRRLTVVVLALLGAGCPTAADERQRALLDQLTPLRQEQERQARQLAALKAVVDDQSTTLASLRAKLGVLEGRRPAAPAEAPPAPGTAQDYTTVFRQTDADARAVRRADLDRLLARTTELARGARIVPLVQNGQVVGMKVFGIRAGSVQAALGLQNGDAITEVAGVPFTVDRVEEALARARGARVIEIKLLRRGAAKVVKVTVER